MIRHRLEPDVSSVTIYLCKIQQCLANVSTDIDHRRTVLYQAIQRITRFDLDAEVYAVLHIVADVEEISDAVARNFTNGVFAILVIVRSDLCENTSHPFVEGKVDKNILHRPKHADLSKLIQQSCFRPH